MGRVEFSVPLPPPSLRANNRSHWARKKKAADSYSKDVYARFASILYCQCEDRGWPWLKARVRYEWRHAGVAPDHGNLGGNTKYLQDIICMAPKAKAGANRWYLGIVENDKGITAEYQAVKVKTKAEECVRVTITEL